MKTIVAYPKKSRMFELEKLFKIRGLAARNTSSGFFYAQWLKFCGALPTEIFCTSVYLKVFPTERGAPFFCFPSFQLSIMEKLSENEIANDFRTQDHEIIKKDIGTILQHVRSLFGTHTSTQLKNTVTECYMVYAQQQQERSLEDIDAVIALRNFIDGIDDTDHQRLDHVNLK